MGLRVHLGLDPHSHWGSLIAGMLSELAVGHFHTLAQRVIETGTTKIEIPEGNKGRVRCK